MSRVRKLLSVPDTNNRVAAALLILRVVFGFAMANHGWGKIRNPLHWLDGAPNPPPGILQAAAAVSEFFGGLAIAFGLLSPAAALGIAATLSYAIYTHKMKGDTFAGAKGGGSYELAALHLTAVLTVLVGGPGRYSLDAILFGKRR
ncbi:MAG: DoxX family protein [Polyangiaceae bacterium]|nr:DoxX family protein [Polyangiaceae bacterium]